MSHLARVSPQTEEGQEPDQATGRSRLAQSTASQDSILWAKVRSEGRGVADEVDAQLTEWPCLKWAEEPVTPSYWE